MQPRSNRIAFLNWAFIVVLVVYWAVALSFFPLVDWYNSLPLPIAVIVPVVVLVATVWGVKFADTYSRKTRGNQPIDNRIHVNKWLTAPLILVSCLPVTRIQDPFHLGHPSTDIILIAFVWVLVFVWSRFLFNATIGDFTFEKG